MGVSTAGDSPSAFFSASATTSRGFMSVLLPLVSCSTLRTAPAIPSKTCSVFTLSTPPTSSLPRNAASGMLMAPLARSFSEYSSAGLTSMILGAAPLSTFGCNSCSSSLVRVSGPDLKVASTPSMALSSAGSKYGTWLGGKTSGRCRSQEAVYLKMSSQKMMTPTFPGLSSMRRMAPTTCMPEEGPAMIDSSRFRRKHIWKASSLVTSQSSS
mmetsp:Transcript_24102/g.56087  ORF Transcript_24102/g.56087 Transcript_24102/m.56087 type:complete len:212 (+) Transcript_24102:142-777(+)